MNKFTALLFSIVLLIGIGLTAAMAALVVIKRKSITDSWKAIKQYFSDFQLGLSKATGGMLGDDSSLPDSVGLNEGIKHDTQRMIGEIYMKTLGSMYPGPYAIKSSEYEFLKMIDYNYKKALSDGKDTYDYCGVASNDYPMVVQLLSSIKYNQIQVI